ncbi:hypothetical protein ASPVEDRAFT_132281 [Aspergillus versicolor CBS 583.65]|uniref:NAD-dependent epimerase/dehydratase domain-containing protein n=1 Tax=Aspergillus versicolor CBS 583.65 TaxID=1036611 RepID=A0A1L9PKW4_ASPVE|nr:uncharacterized protein ASPVEDRAFT_132281 [Aspergillus versicolor CBS 583.65]OJJ02168.1 hypothetical protein ASPVEDRAFT_132281 [Aspergillus versicolor CBS 583.65]
MTSLVLVTGVTGLIGFRVLLETLRKGYTVRFAARSEEKAQKVLSRPAIQGLNAGDRLSYVLIPDISAENAYDEALKGVSYVLHVGTPVPVPGYDPLTQIYNPTVQSIPNLLGSALKTPTLKRLVITSSIVANLAPNPDPAVTSTGATRIPITAPPETISSPFEAYVLGKIISLNATDEFIAKEKPHFSIAHIFPGYVFGRNDLLDGEGTELLFQNSSNGYLLGSILGTEIGMPIHGGYVHIDDVADVHLRVLELDPAADSACGTPHSFGACTTLEAFNTFDIVEKAFPKAVANGTFSRGALPKLPISYDSSETERVLGMKFRSFESAVADTAAQYLESRGLEVA